MVAKDSQRPSLTPEPAQDVTNLIVAYRPRHRHNQSRLAIHHRFIDLSYPITLVAWFGTLKRSNLGSKSGLMTEKRESLRLFPL